MRTTRQMSVTLPLEMADMVRARVESGDYASESEVKAFVRLPRVSGRSSRGSATRWFPPTTGSRPIRPRRCRQARSEHM